MSVLREETGAETLFGGTTMKMRMMAAAAVLSLSVMAIGQVAPEIAKAQAQMAAKDWSGAAATLDAFLKVHPEKPMAWRLRGSVADMLGDDATALADYDLAEKNGAPKGVLVYPRAQAMARMGKGDEAVAMLEAGQVRGLTYTLGDSAFDKVRSSVRFTALAAKNEQMLHPCDDPTHRVFDFWVGEWDVTNVAGGKVGDSKIERILNNCVILENWTGAAGGDGKSYNSLNVQTGKWTQFWVDVAAAQLTFTDGEYKDGAMRFGGHNPGPKGEASLDRFTFFNLGPDDVRQFHETSADGGKTWVVSYDFHYHRKKG